MNAVLSLWLAVASCAILAVSGRSSEGTSFVCAFPRTGDDFDGLVRLTSQSGSTVTIETASETREVSVPAGEAVTESYPMSQRVTDGMENVGVIVTSDTPISVYLDQPSWELDSAMCRPIDADDTEFYTVNFLGETVTASFWPLSFYSVAASEDDTSVTITDPEGDTLEFNMNRFDVYSEDASEAGPGASLIDYTGWHIVSDKPVSVFAGHGRVLFPDAFTNQYIHDAMPNFAELTTSYTTFPVGFGGEDNGYFLRVLATVDGTEVTIADSGVSETINAGEYYELDYGTSNSAFKVGCSAPCYAVQFLAATFDQGGELDTSVGGAMVPLTPDNAFSDDLLVAEPYKETPANNYGMLSIVANTYPVNEVYYNGENVNDLATWVAGTNDEYAFTTLEVPNGQMSHITSQDGELFAAYLYTNVDGGAWGTKAFSAGFN